MPKDVDKSKDSSVCPICGHASPRGSTKCENCYTTLGPGRAAGENEPEPPAKESEGFEELLRIPGVGQSKAEILHEAGYRSLKDIRNARMEELASVKGIGEKLAMKIIESANSLAAPESRGLQNWLEGEDEGLSQWLSGGEESHSSSQTVTKAEAAPSDTLAKWL
ncbi:MAG TPA: helix-hairpin-helix domain-containing protein, partial [Thermoplasmata archaeon]|nr:helix-hairpin-helix domain-containing protein [Thermoplasmata archaeon]